MTLCSKLSYAAAGICAAIALGNAYLGDFTWAFISFAIGAAVWFSADIKDVKIDL